jgi:hypothetical protein
MSLRLVLPTLVLCATSTLPATAIATELLPHAPCLGCTDTEMRAKALAILPNAPGVFSIHVYSLSTNAIKHFQVECMTQDAVDPVASQDEAQSSAPFGVQTDASTTSACNGNRVLTELSVESGKLDVLTALHEIYNRTGGTMKTSVDISINNLPEYGGSRPTIYDMARDRSLRIAYGQYALDASRTGVNQLRVLAENALAYLGFSDGTQLIITLYTVDGGQVTFEWRPPANEPTYVEVSARTAGGQWVPDNNSGEGLHGTTWRQLGPNGNYDDMREFADHLRRLGFPIYRGDTNYPVGTVIPGPVVRVTCEEMPDGKFLCKLELLP